MNLIRLQKQDCNLTSNLLLIEPHKKEKSVCQKVINTIYIIGNKFFDFADSKSVFTLSSFFSWAQQLLKHDNHHTYMVHAGQGISEEDDTTIRSFIKTHHLQEKFLLRGSILPARRAAQYMSHKNYDKNTLIAEPLKLSDKYYESYLMINENCADISDHLTGKHIQGALLIEAARQMTLAVTEKFFISDEQRKMVSFISNAVDTKFHNYAFPLDITIHYDIKKCRGSIKQSCQFIVLVTFLQQDTTVAEVTFDFSVLNKTYVHYKEDEASKAVIARTVAKGVWHEDQAIAA